MTWLKSKVYDKNNKIKKTKVGSGQCVALIKAYYIALGVDSVRGNGCDYAKNALPHGWERIPGETNPQKGDILVWTNGWKGYGHVAICGENKDGKTVYYHQNWKGQYVQILSKSYTDGFTIKKDGTWKAKYWGVIRPDFREESLEYANIEEGTYYIKNLSSGNYMNVLDGKDNNKTTINANAFNGSSAQTFTFTKASKGYELMPGCSSTKVINAYADTVVGGTKINLYKKANESTQRWQFEAVEGGFVIRSVQRPGMCITASKDGTKLTTAVYKGLSRQIWCLESPKFVPAAPDVKISGVSATGKNKLSWEAIDGAVLYTVYRATTKDGKYFPYPTTKTSFTDSSAKAGTKYYYYVVGVNKQGEESEKSEIKIRTCDLPRPDVSIKLNSKGKPNLKWEKIEGATEYKIYRAASKNGDYKLIKTTSGTSYTNTGAEKGKTYYYKVVAVHSKSAANSAYSLIDSITSK